MDFLSPFFHLPEKGNEALELKVKEAVAILLKEAPGLKDILFDFGEPGKIDLEAFMNRNFHFNVEIKRFALGYLRSHTTVVNVSYKKAWDIMNKEGQTGVKSTWKGFGTRRTQLLERL